MAAIDRQTPVDSATRILHIKSEVLENLSLHLDDVEFLQNAFLVQAALGPLVRFSNRGRYEPYIAQSWMQNGNDWTFKLHGGLKCETGETIDPVSFKKSLLGSISRFSAEDLKQTPFVHLKEITTQGNDLTLSFKEPVGKALLEYLAMSPFSFLCESNFENGKWKSRDQMISSGPYRIAEFDAEKNFCVLALRKDWPLNSPESFEKIYLSKEDLPGLNPTALLRMTYGLRKNEGAPGSNVLEVPRALMSARLGIDKGHFFAEKSHRQALQSAVNRELDATEITFENYHRAESFFFGQVTGHEALGQSPRAVEPPKSVLKIRGIPVGTRPEVDFYQSVVLRALDKLGWKYEIMAKAVGSAKDFFDHSYDLAFDRSHVDATLDPDFVRLLFKSKLGPRYQDPNGRISHLVDEFDQGRLSYREFLITFNAVLFDEAAILPLFHRGFVFQFSPNVNTKTISPLMSILRYEEITLKTDERN